MSGRDQRQTMQPRKLNELVKPLTQFEAFGVVYMPDDADEPILPAETREAVAQWMLELNAADRLKAVGETPRLRCMLKGPPGTGKTSLARHVAARIGVPLLVIESSSLIEGILGASARNLAKLFKLARAEKGSVALFFDEIDALATARGREGGSGERDNIVIALLQLFDSYAEQGLIFAATNRADTIDKAMWRRFQMQIEVGMPGDDERFAIIKRYFEPMGIEDDAVWIVANVLEGASPAELREIVKAIKRDLVMAGLNKADESLAAVMARVRVTMEPGGKAPPLWATPDIIAEYVADAPWPPSWKA